MQQKNHDVFISYSRKDAATAKEIYAALTAANISCFFDDNMDNPDVWEILVCEIENCKIFLYLGSKNTAAARITPKELTYAINHKDRSCIYPYFIDDFALPKVHEFLLADINWRKRSSHPLETGLIPDLKNILEQENNEISARNVLTEKVVHITVGGVSFKMIRVEGGPFIMGSPDNDSDASDDEKPQHWVTLSDFFIGETPVTQTLWETVMGYNPSHNKGDSLPVDNVSWIDCQDFIKQINNKTGMTFRLPTEAEWEYAARGGRKGRVFKYAGSNDVNAVAWYVGKSGNGTHPVKQKGANELDLYDMSGNVWEWCQDWYDVYKGSAQTNPTGPTSGSGRVLRGGCWRRNARDCRVATRNSISPGHSNPNFGFRLAIFLK